jgi:hypothetical protein
MPQRCLKGGTPGLPSLMNVHAPHCHASTPLLPSSQLS